MKVIDGFFIVYGGGKFGNRTVDALKERRQQYYILIIDSDPSCLVGQLYQHSQFESILKKIKTHELTPKSGIDFVQGDISTLFEICEIVLPQYLIPTAPIHVMKDFLLRQLELNHPEVKYSQMKPKFLQDITLPENLNLKFRNKEVYYSYASWDSLCPPNCPAPSKYCSFHDLIKPIDLNLFLNKILSRIEEKGKIISFLFDSAQLAPGIGGISGEVIRNSLIEVEKNLDNFDGVRKMTLIISTACKCHGILGAYQIRLKKGKS